MLSTYVYFKLLPDYTFLDNVTAVEVQWRIKRVAPGESDPSGGCLAPL